MKEYCTGHNGSCTLCYLYFVFYWESVLQLIYQMYLLVCAYKSSVFNLEKLQFYRLKIVYINLKLVCVIAV